MIPAQTQILNEIGYRLGNISVANGYGIDINTISRARRENFSSNEMPAINYFPNDDEPYEEERNPYGYKKRLLTVGFEAYKGDIGNPADNAFDIANVIWLALYRSTANPTVSDQISPDLGGLVVNMKLQNVLPLLANTPDGIDNWHGSLFGVSIIYKVLTDNPFILKT